MLKKSLLSDLGEEEGRVRLSWEFARESFNTGVAVTAIAVPQDQYCYVHS